MSATPEISLDPDVYYFQSGCSFREVREIDDSLPRDDVLMAPGRETPHGCLRRDRPWTFISEA